MKFACLLYGVEADLAALPDARLASMAGACHAAMEELRGNGYLLAAFGLQSTQAASTVRQRDGRAAITDGPFAETKEQLGGLAIVEARDLNEALRIAAQLPPARFGSIEVRPLLEPGAPVATDLDRRLDGAIHGAGGAAAGQAAGAGNP
jgi:hypothetical protein